MDRIEFMMYPSGEECSYIYRQLRSLETFGRAYVWRNTYTTSALVFVSTAPTLNLFFRLGYAHERNYVKVGWVLYGITDEHRAAMATRLNEIVPGGTGRVFNSNVGYIEVAADFTGIGMEDVEAFDTRLQDGFVWPRSRRPKQTIYCGSRTGIRRLCVYDRRMRLSARGVELTQSELRVEARMRFHGRTLTLPDIADIRNPFATVYLVDFERLADSLSARRDSRFLIDSERHGLNSALHWSPPWDKKRRIGAMKRHALSPWWERELEWRGIEDALAGVAIE